MCHCNGNCAYKNYVLNGRGIGLKIVSLTALVVAIAFMAVLGGFATSVMSQKNVEAFFKSLPVIEFDHGKLVKPAYDNHIVTMEDLNYILPLSVVVNTIGDHQDEMPRDTDVYITSEAIYLLDDIAKDASDMLRFPYRESLNGVVTPQDLKHAVKTAIWGSAVFFGLALILFIVMLYLVSYLAVIAFGWIFNREITLDTWGRLFSVPFALVTVLFVGMIFLNVEIPFVSIFVAIPVAWVLALTIRRCAQACDCECAGGCSCEGECCCCAKHESDLPPVIVVENKPVEKPREKAAKTPKEKPVKSAAVTRKQKKTVAAPLAVKAVKATKATPATKPTQAAVKPSKAAPAAKATKPAEKGKKEMPKKTVKPAKAEQKPASKPVKKAVKAAAPKAEKPAKATQKGGRGAAKKKK